jgi:hypothetical protein
MTSQHCRPIFRGRKERSKFFLLDPIENTMATYFVSPPGGLKITRVKNISGTFTDMMESQGDYYMETVLFNDGIVVKKQ